MLGLKKGVTAFVCRPFWVSLLTLLFEKHQRFEPLAGSEGNLLGEALWGELGRGDSVIVLFWFWGISTWLTLG